MVIVDADVDLSDLVECIRRNHMIIVVSIPFSLSRPGTIRQDEVEHITCTILFVVFKANELINRPRLEPLFKERGFIKKLKQSSSVPAVFTVMNVFTVLSILTVLTVFTM